MKRTSVFCSLAALLLGFPSAHAAVIGQLGILQDTANGGINPATGNPWAAGDTYRLVFITSTTNTASSSNIADYNAFVQGVANAHSALLGSVTWTAIGSTATVDARDNTGTNPTVSTGVAIFNFNNLKIANNNAALWDGGIDNPVDYDESGNLFPDFTNVATGTDANGLATTDVGTGTLPKVLGGSNEATPNIQYGRSHFNDGRWTRSFSGAATGAYRFYALSEELTVIPEPSSVALLGLGGITLLLRRRR